MNNPLDFTGKVALVTGAAAGMGLATAQAFAEAGAAVVLADFKEDAVKAEAENLLAAGHKALRCVVMSVTTHKWRRWWTGRLANLAGSTRRSTMLASWPESHRPPTAPATSGSVSSGSICAACGAA
jgi:NAD(P)-dependent dehydrogenase (short-subunit alcohol dehydrogenase family)